MEWSCHFYCLIGSGYYFSLMPRKDDLIVILTVFSLYKNPTYFPHVSISLSFKAITLTHYVFSTYLPYFEGL